MLSTETSIRSPSELVFLGFDKSSEVPGETEYLLEISWREWLCLQHSYSQRDINLNFPLVTLHLDWCSRKRKYPESKFLSLFFLKNWGSGVTTFEERGHIWPSTHQDLPDSVILISVLSNKRAEMLNLSMLQHPKIDFLSVKHNSG